MWAILLLPLLVALLIFIIKTKFPSKRNEIKPIRDPPGPPKIPIIGNFHQLGSLPHRSYFQLSKKYGPVMLLRLGKVPLIVISSAEAAMDILKTNEAECCNRPSLTAGRKLSYNGQDIALSPYGKHWREVRKFCVLNLFSTKTVKSFRSVREDEVKSLMDSLYVSSLSSSLVDIGEKMTGLTASIVFRIAFGKCFGESSQEKDGFRDTVRIALSAAGTFAAYDILGSAGWIIDRLTGFHSRLEKSFSKLDSFFEHVIGEHLNRTVVEEQEDLVDLLLKMEREQSETGQALFTRENIKAILMDILFGGVDTGAIFLTWAMAELVRNPRVMKKAQIEARSYAASKGELTIGESEIQELQYLKMVLKETLRLHPPGLLAREALSRFKLGDYDVLPKTLIQINVWAIGQDPEYWKNPEEFFPERFADSSVDYKGNHFELLPFGSGRRICPGIQMGMAVVELALANLLCCFDWKLPNGMDESNVDMEEKARLSVFKKHPLKLIPKCYRLSFNQDSDT